MAIDSRGRDKPEELDYDEILGDLEKRLERVKILYEQYFMGIEKMEPQTARKEVARKIIELTQHNIRNTGIRYRFNSLTQKWGVYQQYWGRILRQIEAGTYFRNLSKVGRQAIANGDDIPEEILRKMPARMRERIKKDREAIRARVAREADAKGPGEAPPATATAATDAGGVMPASSAPAARPRVHQLDPEDADLSDAFVDDLFDSIVSGGESKKAAPATPVPPSRPATSGASAPSVPPPRAPTPPPFPRATTPPPTAARAATPAPAGTAPLPPGMDESATRNLYKQYVQAKKLVGEDTSKLRYETLVATLSKQAPQIMKQHQAAAVDFSVVIKDDKVILKATPKK